MFLDDGDLGPLEKNVRAVVGTSKVLAVPAVPIIGGFWGQAGRIFINILQLLYHIVC